jgi:tetratricopeptide (TPR) repeat protein/tRNA A-37 threonylcarbamoyl transferase component Bud32
MQRAMASTTPVEAGDATERGLDDTGPGDSPGPARADLKATVAHTSTFGADAARPPVDATRDWTPDPTDPDATTDGRGAASGLPRGTTIRYFGDYEIQKELGRGGMGVVYKARQVSLNRPVALKMIKAGALSDEAELRRFRNEAEAVALLDHASIVPVYEVGEHDGQNYFSMKLVEGGNLAEQLLTFQGNPRAAAILMAETAEAVHHAHMRGILHRDLKPANILIDAEGHPHVTDFGLAKLIESDVELTASGAIMGTPSYMSPEQATGRRAALTTATDVYGLGAILYALLTGKAPFRGDSLVDTLQAVKERPPDSPRNVNSSVPRDLETICLKCLEKDPRRRYTSAQALADDLRCWLGSHPIAARRVGAAERAWLWCRRRPAIAALAAAVLLAAGAGSATTIAVQYAANRRLDAKNQELDRANAELARSKEAVQARYELAVGATQAFHSGVSEDFLLKQDQFKELRDRLLKSAQDFYGKLSALLGRETDQESRRALLASNFELADLTGKVGSKEDALKAHRAVLAAQEALATQPGVGAAMTVDVGRSLFEIAVLLEETGQSGEAAATYRRSESLLSGSAGTDTAARAARASCRSRLGWLLSQTGQATDALAALRQALADQEALAAVPGASAAASRDLANTVYRIGKVLMSTGKPSEAEAEYRRALEIRQKLADDHPAVTDFRFQLAGSHHTLGVLMGDTGKLLKAEAEFRQALDIYQQLAAVQPAVAEFRRRVADIYNNLGNVLMMTGKPSEAEAECRRALEIFRKLAADQPAVTDFRFNLVIGHGNLGRLLTSVGSPTEAEAELRQALEVGQKLADDNPTVTEYRRFLSHVRNNLGDAHRSLGRAAGARDSYDRAIALEERALQEAPTSRRYCNDLAWSLRRRGLTRRDLGDMAGAAADARRALALWEGLPSRTSEEWFETACCHAALAGLAGRASSGVSADEGITDADAAMDSLRRAVGMGYRSPEIFRTEDALGPLRGRDDLRLLMMDVAFPVEAFARGE